MTHPTRRKFLKRSLAATAALAVPARVSVAAPNDAVRVGFVGCGQRAAEHAPVVAAVPGVSIAGLCDPDGMRRDMGKRLYPGAKAVADMRRLFEDPGIDAVFITTCDHWHALAAIWAMEAGKDVYIEKPLAHNFWEGQQIVAAAKKYGRICQVGTQQRSDPMQAEIRRFLHEEKALGKIETVRAHRYRVRGTIGKRDAPLAIPEIIDYNLWLGPAQDVPIWRKQIHYDWHWVWNTGTGEIGNWLVHVLDDVQNVVFLDRMSFPKRLVGGGGRLVWNDAGETPNLQFVWLDTGTIPVILALCQVTAGPESDRRAAYPGPGTGYIVYCEGGRLEGERYKASAFDRKGNLIRTFQGDGGTAHQKNFLDAVRAHDASLLAAPLATGYLSSSWCQLANISYRAGGTYNEAEAKHVSGGCLPWEVLLTQMEDLLRVHKLKLSSKEIQFSPMLYFDPQQELFTGGRAEAANSFLRRTYREPFVVPQIAS